MLYGISETEIGIFAQVPAVIVVGGGPDFDKAFNIWDATQLCANFAYQTLIYQGFTKEGIQELFQRKAGLKPAPGFPFFSNFFQFAEISVEFSVREYEMAQFGIINSDIVVNHIFWQIPFGEFSDFLDKIQYHI